jgi:predicted transcriptional regulator
MNTARELLAVNIKIKRKELSLTQEKLAELVDISYQMIHDIEGCRTGTCEGLEVDIYELLCPQAAVRINDKKSKLSPTLMARLRKTMKSDIDRRLDDFYGKVKK